MKINDEYAPFFWTKEERKEFEKLNAKLEQFARRGFYTHWFRGEIAGIPPSGDDYTDFVVRAYLDCYPANGKFKIDKEFKNRLYNRIRAEISRESRKKINNAVRNEAYYKEKYTEDFDIFGLIPDEELSVRDQLIEEERNKVKGELVGEFCQYLKDEKYKMIISLFNAEKISFERLLTKVTDFPLVLINQLINHQLIFDASGLTTEKFARMDRPCKMKLKLPLKGKRSNSHLFGILKMDRSINKARYIAYYLGMTEKDYYVYIRKLREQFIVFFNNWKNQGDNAKILGELGLFQYIKE